MNSQLGTEIRILSRLDHGKHLYRDALQWMLLTQELESYHTLGRRTEGSHETAKIVTLHAHVRHGHKRGTSPALASWLKSKTDRLNDHTAREIRHRHRYSQRQPPSP